MRAVRRSSTALLSREEILKAERYASSLTCAKVARTFDLTGEDAEEVACKGRRVARRLSVLAAAVSRKGQGRGEGGRNVFFAAALRSFHPRRLSYPDSCRLAASIVFRPPPAPVISIRRGFACSATGIVSVRTPSS